MGGRSRKSTGSDTQQAVTRRDGRDAGTVDVETTTSRRAASRLQFAGIHDTCVYLGRQACRGMSMLLCALHQWLLTAT